MIWIKHGKARNESHSGWRDSNGDWSVADLVTAVHDEVESEFIYHVLVYCTYIQITYSPIP